MPISQAHSDAARRNGSLSTGPATPEGHERSSQNARKHNLFGSTQLLPTEDAALFAVLAEEITAEFKPTTFLEIRCVREMIDAEWRLQRVREHAAIIQARHMFDLNLRANNETAADAFEKIAKEGPCLQLLLRYEAQFRRQFDKALQQLTEYRRANQAEQERILREQQAEQIRMLNAFINAPTPGERNPAHMKAAMAAQAAAIAARAAAAKLQNEPSNPTRMPPQPACAADVRKPAAAATGA
ncbi:MAG: hypothetical protein HY820_20630 [Acidobacteria bacterium]|nr:hypothetical protein [Acidobacteriota bacterium]